MVRPALAPRWPVELTSFVARPAELGELAELAASARLLSVVGPGGGGKSRLALRLADALAGQFPDGRFWVDLAALSGDGGSVVNEVATALDLPEGLDHSMAEAVAAHLRDRRALIVLDSCEHLIEGCAALASQIIQRCPHVLVVATTREALRVDGEVVWLVPPLTLPDAATVLAAAAGERSALDRFRASSGPHLLGDRICRVSHDFVLTAHNAEPVARVVRRLDGLPLALELAAARTRSLTVHELAERLDDDIELLGQGTRSGPARHRTLRDTLDWSFRLLPDDEAELFLRLAAFGGSFSLAAVEAIAPGVHQPLAALSQLVDKSLVTVTSRGDRTRYRLLGTVRHYALAALTAAGAPNGADEADRADDPRALHAAYFRDIARDPDKDDWARAGPGGSPTEPQDDPVSRRAERRRRLWLAQVAQERDNLRVALQWFVRQGLADDALLLTTGLCDAWYRGGRFREAQEWLELALRCPGATDDHLRARAVVASGRFAQLRCDYATASSRLEEGLMLHSALDDDAGTAVALQVMGSVAREQGRYDEAVVLHRRSRTLWEGLGDRAEVLRADTLLGFVHWLRDDVEEAAQALTHSLLRAQSIGAAEDTVSSLLFLGAIADARGEQVRARVLLDEALQLAAEHEWAEGVAWATNLLGVAARHRGGASGIADAREILGTALVSQRRLGDLWRVASILDQLAAAEVDAGDAVRCAWLAGIAQGVRDLIGTPVPRVEMADREAALRRALGALGVARFGEAFAAGRVTRPADVVPRSRSEPDPGAAPGAEVRQAYAPEPRAATEPAAPLLEVLALGPAAVSLGGHELEPAAFSYAKPRELLFFLLSREGATKGEIGAALWPWSTSQQLRNSFHTTLHHLRSALGGGERIVFAGGRYALDRELPYRYDVEDFRRLVTTAGDVAAARPVEAIELLEAAVRLYRGEFLADLPGGEWIGEQRSQLRRTWETVLLRLGALHTGVGAFRAASEVLRVLVDADPLVESAQRELIRSYVRLGDRGLAMQQYRRLVRVLRVELDTTPSPESVELARTLRTNAP